MKKLAYYLFPKYYQKMLLSRVDLPPSLRHYLLKPLVDKKTLIKDIEFLVLDFETTGLNPAKEKIISMGYTVIKDLHLLAASSQHLLINPERSLTEENVSIHQLTDDDLSQGVSLNNAMEQLFSQMENRVMIVHFDNIERRFINCACQKLYKINCLPMAMLDTLKIETKKIIRTKGYIQSESLRLFSLREKYNLPRYKAHNAMQDAISTAELFLAQVSHMGDSHSIELKDLMS